MILRLARLQIQSHRLRTMFVAVAVVLTSILYMTVISISYCILDSTQLSMMLAAGSDFHASVSDTGYSISGETLRREIQNSPEVSEAFLLGMGSAFSTDAAYTDRGNQGMNIVFTDSEKILSHLFMTPTEGKFPRSTDEIMLYVGTFSSLSVGDHVQFTYDCSNGKTEQKSYTVSGFYDCDADRPIPAVTLYDGDTVQKLDLAVEVTIRFHSSFGIDRRLDAVKERLLEEWELPGADRYSQINYAYAAADIGEFFRPGNILLILCVVAVVFFAAFLLIYNIFSISLAQDMRTFGLLRVIGTTHRQMKKLIYVQIILIGCAALPIGLLLGYFIGFKLLSPVFMSLSGAILPYRFSSWIVPISAGLTWFTLSFSALRPLKRIKKMTPVQSVSAEPEEDRDKKDRHREIPASPRSLALAGIRRSRGRMLITSLSAMVSVLLFVIVGGLVDGFVGSTYERLGMFDIDLSLHRAENSVSISTVPPSFQSPSFRAAIEPDVTQKLVSSDAVSEMYLLCFERIRAEVSPVLEEKIRAYLEQQKNEFVRKEYQDIIESGLINSVVIGIPDELCQYIVISQEAGKTVYFNEVEQRGGFHVLCISTSDNGQSFGGIRLFTGDMLSSDALEMNYEVIGAKLPYGIYTALRKICSYSYVPGGFSGEDALFLLPMSVFEKEFPDSPVFTVLANAKDGMEEILLEEVQECTDGRGMEINGVSYCYRTAGRLNQLAELQIRLAAIRLTGYSLCGIIFLIGLLNMVNSALTSMVLRRREFAMLETVGMTRDQLRRMLLYENSEGGVFGLAAFVVGSVLSNALLTRTFGVNIAPISLPAIGILLFLFAAGGVTAELSYRMLTKQTLTERVRLGE